MARSKSTTGGRTTRTTKEQPNSGVTANAPETTPAVSAIAETAAVKAAPENPKFELLKNESKKNVLPINLEEEIRRRAYELYQQRGDSGGSPAEDWINAEREVRQRYHQLSNAQSA